MNDGRNFKRIKPIFLLKKQKMIENSIEKEENYQKKNKTCCLFKKSSRLAKKNVNNKKS